jgi:hypothetical protein
MFFRFVYVVIAFSLIFVCVGHDVVGIEEGQKESEWSRLVKQLLSETEVQFSPQSSHSFNSSQALKTDATNSSEIDENRRESGLYLKLATVNPCPKNQRQDRRGSCRKLANVE